MAKGTRISRSEAEKFLILYNKLGTYKAVADKMDRSPEAVSKWVKILQAESTNKRIYNVLEVLKMNGNIESFDAEIAKGKIRKYKIRIY